MTRRKRLSLRSNLGEAIRVRRYKINLTIPNIYDKNFFFRDKKSKSLQTPLDYQATRQQDEA